MVVVVLKFQFERLSRQYAGIPTLSVALRPDFVVTGRKVNRRFRPRGY